MKKAKIVPREPMNYKELRKRVIDIETMFDAAIGCADTREPSKVIARLIDANAMMATLLSDYAQDHDVNNWYHGGLDE